MNLSLFLALTSAFLPLSIQQDEDIPHNEVKNWALKFGKELWEFGRQFTKMNEIQRKYHEHDAEVARKDGLLLIREMATEVKNMMDIKMNSVMLVNTQFSIRLTCTVEAPQLHQENENAQVITKYESVERVDFEPTNKAEIWLPARFKTIIDEKTIDNFNQDVSEMEYALTFEGTDLWTRAHRVAIKPAIHPQPV